VSVVASCKLPDLRLLILSSKFERGSCLVSSPSLSRRYFLLGVGSLDFTGSSTVGSGVPLSLDGAGVPSSTDDGAGV
jgi:hypothetical protein